MIRKPSTATVPPIILLRVSVTYAIAPGYRPELRSSTHTRWARISGGILVRSSTTLGMSFAIVITPCHRDGTSIRKPTRDTILVSHEQQRTACCGPLVQVFGPVDLTLLVQPIDGLIQDQQRRIMDDRQQQPQLLPHSM